MRRHIAHARSVLSTPVTIVKIPIMRFIFVSVEKLDEAVGWGSARLWLVYSVVIREGLTHFCARRQGFRMVTLYKCDQGLRIKYVII